MKLMSVIKKHCLAPFDGITDNNFQLKHLCNLVNN